MNLSCYLMTFLWKTRAENILPVLFCCIHNVPSAQRGVKKLLTIEANNPDSNFALHSLVNRKSQSKPFDLSESELYVD